MHLLNTRTLQLEPRTNEIKTYAILSHRWEKEEVLFEHITGNREHVAQLRGYTKVRDACERARRDGHSYIWIDTCCIDKRSSAELSEAINSMFIWYGEAAICYAYLSDVLGNVNARYDPAFAKSQWFSRGWTLQELIAPRQVIFFSKSWKELGRKTTLQARLSSITGIDEDVLAMKKSLDLVSVAKRMSWAANRTTTRIEDMAYSLMGLFNVNMPILYGEGKRAFIRLQEEIMKYSADETLFAWRDPNAEEDERVGLLATSPEMFKNSEHYVPYGDWEYHQPFSMTNQGLKISFPLQPVPLVNNVYFAALNCPMPGKDEGFMGIFLKRISAFDDSKFKNQYARVRATQLVSFKNLEERGQATKLHVRQTFPRYSLGIYPERAFQIRHIPAPDSGYKHIGTMGTASMLSIMLSERTGILKEVPSAFKMAKAMGELTCVVVFERKDETQFGVLLGSLTTAGDVGVDVLPQWDRQTFNEIDWLFVAQPVEQDLATGKDIVTVDINTIVKGEVKYFIADISIKIIADINVGMKPPSPDFLTRYTFLRSDLHAIPEFSEIVASKDT